LHRLTTSFVLGYHGCDRDIGERLLAGEAFKPSNNDYDWLGPGVYFWEANPRRGIDFAAEAARRRGNMALPSVVGAVIDLGNCLDLTTATGIELVRNAYANMLESSRAGGWALPVNSLDGLRRQLDCAVITHLHQVLPEASIALIDTVRAILPEGNPIYPGSGFSDKTHTQIAVCNPACIRGIFRVPADQLR
jgi:hypothetical protein